MNIPYFKITGWGGAIRSMYMTNKNYTSELEIQLRRCEKAYESYNDLNITKTVYEDDAKWFKNEINKVLKIGKKHITLLRYVDVEWIVDGLHRGAQDDFDSHAERFDNRIIRMTTRTINDGKLAEISDWYKDKILTFQDITKLFNLPEEVEKAGVIFARTPFGYIRKETIGSLEERDVRRGLIPLAVASTFIVKCQITELCHVFRERNQDGNASPELKIMMEDIVKKISEKYPELDRDFFINSCLQ